ncbi:type II/IV secretion system protein [Candidatus Fermentibacteria bacterium]|nr:type II/IV secretion system protein [Candidatus Fermentibacteria bacterium]
MKTFPRLNLTELPERLKEAGILTEDGLMRLERLQETSEEPLLSLLVNKGMVDEEKLYRFIAEISGLKYKVLDPLELDYEVVTESLPGAYAKNHRLIAFGATDDVLQIATSNLVNLRPLEDLVHLLDKEIDLHVSRPSEVNRVIRQFYGLHSSLVAAAKEMGASPDDVDLGNLERYVSSETADTLEPTDRPIVNAVNHLLQYAFEERASDIHIEPHREGIVVRLRIDGVLHTIYTIPKNLHLPILSRLKMVAGMNIAEKRRPQDGRIGTHFDGKPVEIRLSTVPMAFGEKAVLRILDPAILMQDLSTLGLEEDQLVRYRSMISEPYGLILVTGPTGSGKTTTLYSTLTAIATPEQNITTIEDPIEFVTDEFNQIGVQPAVGVNFVSALRHVLRQDPDVVMVGEIRDEETARSAIRSALTGHLVLSTLHTNDTATAAVRLIDMGIEPYLLCSTLVGVVAQRLVRKVCPECGESYVPSESVKKSLGVADDDSVRLRRGKGCRLCRGTGYKGRTAVFEIMRKTQRIEKNLLHEASVDEVRATSQEEGMKTLRESARRKVVDGVTTTEEMLRVTV